MKQLLILFFLLPIAASVCTAQSQLHVRLADNSVFSISVNGRHFKRQGTSITVGDLPPGKHHVKIYSIVHDRWGRGYQKSIYQGRIATEYRMTTDFTFDPYTQRTNVREFASGAGEDMTGRNYERYKKDDEVETPLAASDKPAASPVASPLATGSLTNEKSEKLKKKTDARRTDTEKLKLVKDELKAETVTTQQVSAIMDWFLFESTRLDFAKWAYGITTDKNYYQDISATFSYKSSKEELERFIKERK